MEQKSTVQNATIQMILDAAQLSRQSGQFLDAVDYLAAALFLDRSNYIAETLLRQLIIECVEARLLGYLGYVPFGYLPNDRFRAIKQLVEQDPDISIYDRLTTDEFALVQAAAADHPAGNSPFALRLKLALQPPQHNLEVIYGFREILGKVDIDNRYFESENLDTDGGGSTASSTDPPTPRPPKRKLN